MTVTDPKAPRQPVPAHDGADYLKTIPGFAVIRKGGTDGDPVLRGMAGSRLNLLLDGEQILGGCGARMDPPTAYVFPETFDRITVIKGPQTVLYGPGNSAGAVLFERDTSASPSPARASRQPPGRQLRPQRRGRRRARGTPEFYVAGRRHPFPLGDYADGDGQRVHSALHPLERQRAPCVDAGRRHAPGADRRRSDGEAAYADRSMDGVSSSARTSG